MSCYTPSILSTRGPKVLLFYLLTDHALRSLPDGVADKYRPCAIDPKHGYTLVYEVELPANTSSDQLNIQLCSPGGYDQVQISFSLWLHTENPVASF